MFTLITWKYHLKIKSSSDWVLKLYDKFSYEAAEEVMEGSEILDVSHVTHIQ